MGRRGPQPKPKALKVLEGTERYKDFEINELQPTPIAPKRPTWLPDEGKKQWKQLAPELESLGLLTIIDGQVFALMLVHWSLAVEAAKTLKKEGCLTTDERGLKRKHPACQVLRDNSLAFKQYMAEFGLSPVSRTGLDLPNGEEDKEFAALLD